MLGAALGTSTTTAYIESAAGVEEGGRTGLTALVVAVLFLASLFLAPLAQTVPPYATAPALLFVACRSWRRACSAINGTSQPEYIPALTIALMIPLSYSIATGIGLGFIAYVALKLLSGRVREINARLGDNRRRLPAQADLCLTPWVSGGSARQRLHLFQPSRMRAPVLGFASIAALLAFEHPFAPRSAGPCRHAP